MRFALLGDHPDGLDMAAALVDSGRHSFAVCSTSLAELELRRLGAPRIIPDVEEILADPAVEAVIVAGSPAVRPAQLRRAVQSERHVLCVHPADGKPDAAYEAAMLQRDTGHVLFPLLPEGLHPAVARLAEFVQRSAEQSETPNPVGTFCLLQFERASTEEVLENAQSPGLEPSLPAWDLLRRLGGELSEVSSFTDGDEVAASLPLLVAGRFDRGGLFQVTLLPNQPSAWWHLVVTGTSGQAELTFPQGWNGPAILQWRDETGSHEQYWDRWDVWPALVDAFEAALREEQMSTSWQDEVRALELDDAARRSVERRRVNLMEYQQASEEVGFKGTMTLVGCAMLWIVLLLLIAARWAPWVGWLILPLLVVFIGMQLLRWAIPSGQVEKTEKSEQREQDSQ
jgi:predicted dehydrogenase